MELLVDDVARWLEENATDIMAAADTSEREVMRAELAGSLEALPIYALKLLYLGDFSGARRAFSLATSILDCYDVQPHWYYTYMSAILRLKAGGAHSVAEQEIAAILRLCRSDELCWFYLGNACYGQGKTTIAIKAYDLAISYKKTFREAMANRQAALLGEKLPYVDVHLDLDDFRVEDWQRLPIFINSRDRVGCLRSLVDWLVAAGHTNIIILDNASTYQPLLDYYHLLERSNNIKVVYLGENLGHTAIWRSDILEKMDIHTPYVYTDSDVLPDEQCPQDLVRQLLVGLKRYPWLDKCGVRLRIDDVPGYCDREWETRLSQLLLDAEFFFAPTDTTFALYNNHRHYTLINAARTRNIYQARHIPWYYEEGSLPADEKYYREHANRSSSAAKRSKENKAPSNDKKAWHGFFF